VESQAGGSCHKRVGSGGPRPWRHHARVQHERVLELIALADAHDVLLARRLEEIAKETLARRERQLAEAEGRYALGTATDYDVLAARVARDNQRPEVLRGAQLVARALDRFRLVLAEEYRQGDGSGRSASWDASKGAFRDSLERIKFNAWLQTKFK
jgi:hypothetical protein